MAGRDRIVVRILRLPEELCWIIENFYQNDRALASKNAAYRELLETHPRVAELTDFLYAGRNREGHETGG